ncbi:MAG: T9SS type A sorting domain-containing protein, partial [Bacteroidales bacterium]
FIIKGSTSGGSGYNSNFKKLNYGVYALASTPNRFPDISHTGFEDNQKGVYLSGISNAQVNYCSFTTSAGQTGGYGLYLDGCRNYWVEGNEFSNAGTSNLFGIYVNDTRPTGPEMIYRNYFAGLDVGIMALNRNRTLSGEGLVLKCNEYVDTDWNQVVYFEGPVLNQEIGIAQNQGSPGEQPDAPAGNRFSWTGPLGTPTDINNQANHITYYYHVDPLVKLKPEYYTESTVTIAPNEDADWDPEQSCPSHLDPGGGGGGGLDDTGELRQLIASSEQQADSVGQLIQALEDAGDTPGLTWTVDMSTPNQAYEVYNQLMGAAPFVSDTVMAAAIQKESVMVDAMIRDVMVANPESAKEDHLLELLGERFNPLPEYMLGQILQGRSLVSVYGELKSKQAYWMQQRSLAMNMLKAYYLADTVNPEASLDTLAMLLAAENTADARYQLAMLHAGRHDWSGAMAVLNGIPQYFTLDQDGLQSHQDMVSFMGLLQQMDGSLPDSAQAAALFALLGQENGKAPVYARNILIAAGLLAYEEPVIYPDPYKSSKEIEFERLVKLAGEHRMIEVFPNPAGSYFIVKWEVEKPANHMEVRLTSSTGQAVMKMPVSGSENQQIVPTQGIKAGVYVVSLHVGGKTLDSVKITIVH